MHASVRSGLHPTKVTLDGTHRICPPDETVRRARAIAPLVGITRVANVTGLDHVGIPVVMVARPNSRSLSVAQGKGITLEHAIASGLMESIELFHAEEPACDVVTAAADELGRLHRLARIDLMRHRRSSRFHRELEIPWVRATDWYTGENVWVPLEAVRVDFSLPRPSGSGCFLEGSNGLASGNDFDEALSHAVCELIERDAKTLWSMLGAEERVGTVLDLDSVNDPTNRDLIARCVDAGLLVQVWDVTSDIGIACLHCRIIDADENPFRKLSSWGGTGCHPSRSVALARAITEAAQSRLTYIAGARDDLLPAAYRAVKDATRRDEKRRFFASTPTEAREFASVPDHATATIHDDLTLLRSRLASIGLSELLVVDLTRDDLGVAVVRAIAPGLECGEVADYRYGARAFGLPLGNAS